MSERPRLDAYHFYEREWESYDELLEAFEWEVPETFNTAAYVCDRWAAETPERVALYVDDGDSRETWTFADLRGAADAVAVALRDRGVGRGDRVGVCARQRPETLVAHLACWTLGAVSVPLSTLFGTDALAYRLDDAGAVACFADSANADTLREVAGDVPSLGTVVAVGDAAPRNGEVAFEELLAADGAVETAATGADEDAIVIYTSGTTGDPKGVRHGHRVLLGDLPLFLTSFCDLELHEDDVFWTPSEWAWVATLYDVLLPALFYGRPVVAYGADEGFDPATAMDVLERYGVTNFFAPPTALRMMQQLDTGGWDVATVRCLPTGGESVGESIAEWAADAFDGAVVNEAYGQTEANLTVGDCAALLEAPDDAIGRRAPGHEVAIVDPETAEATVPPGEVGEIAVRYEGNPVCFKEYWGEPEKTAEKVRNGWLLTEDLGRMDEDGFVAFHSRKDSVIISAGYRIGPVEIEEALAAHEAVADAGVVGVPDDERGEVPKAFVVLAAGYEGNEDLEERLRRHVRDRLAEYEYPRYFEFVESLPKTTTGKVRRSALEERGE